MVAEAIAHAVGHLAAGGESSPIGRPLHQAINTAYPGEIPGPAELFWAIRTGNMSPVLANYYLSNHGICWYPGAGIVGTPDPWPKRHRDAINARAWDQVYQSQTPQIQQGELLALLNRQRITADYANRTLLRHGYDNPAVRDLLLSLRDDLPGSADLVRFSIRHVFEPDLLLEFGFLEEERPEFEFWHSQQGLGYNWLAEPYYSQYEAWRKANGYSDEFSLAKWKNLGIDRMSWARSFWASHWVWLSPQQGYTALQRLRPSGGPGGGPRDPSGQIFDSRKLRLLLRGNDYPPQFRGILEAISYRKLGIRQIAQELKAGLIDYNEAVESYQDIGYARPDAIRFANLSQHQGQAAVKKENLHAISAAIKDGYRTGVVSRDDATRNLYYASLSNADAIDQFLRADGGQQLALASADRTTAATMSALDLEVGIAHAKRVINSTRRNFIKGRLDTNQAMGFLRGAGVSADQANALVQDWQLDIQGTGRELGAGTILKAYRFGIITQAQAVRRLSNLGYDPDAITAMVGLANRDISLDIARALVKAAKDQKAQLAAQQQVVRQAKATLAAEQRALARQGSEGQLVRWYVRGLISETVLRSRLKSLGLNDPYLSELAEEAVLKRQDFVAKACAKKKGPYPAGLTCPPGTPGATPQDAAP